MSLEQAATPRGRRGCAAAATAAAKLRTWAGGAEALSDAQLRFELKQLVKQCTCEELASLGCTPAVPMCLPPISQLELLPMADRLAGVQAVITRIAYNHTGICYFDISKKRPFCSIMGTARDTLREPLPIKCVEATFVALLATCGWQGLDRVGLGFKSRGADCQCYRHIVLAVRDTATGFWGALGISRRRELMDKPLVHASLSSLVADYVAAYSRWGHEIVKVRAGLPAPHDAESKCSVCWRYISVDLPKRGWPSAAAALDAHATRLEQLQDRYKAAAAAAAAAAEAAADAGRAAPAGAKPQAPAARAGAGSPVGRGKASSPGAARPQGERAASPGRLASRAAAGCCGTVSSSSSPAGPIATGACDSEAPGGCSSSDEGGGSSSCDGGGDDDFGSDSEKGADSVVVALRSPRRH